MMKKVVFGVLLGATVGMGLHFLFAPAIGGKCLVLCNPYRAVVAGAVLFGLAVFLQDHLARKKKARAAQSEQP